MTEIFIDRALARAAELDEHLKRTGKVVGPFHGWSFEYLKLWLKLTLVGQVFPFLSKTKWVSKGWTQRRVGSRIQTNLPASLLISRHFLGYVSWIGKPATKNAVLTDILESLGAVLYVKTNVPQTLMVSRCLSPHSYMTLIIFSGLRLTIIFLGELSTHSIAPSRLVVPLVVRVH